MKRLLRKGLCISIFPFFVFLCAIWALLENVFLDAGFKSSYYVSQDVWLDLWHGGSRYDPRA